MSCVCGCAGAWSLLEHALNTLEDEAIATQCSAATISELWHNMKLAFKVLSSDDWGFDETDPECVDTQAHGVELLLHAADYIAADSLIVTA